MISKKLTIFAIFGNFQLTSKRP